jgi:hypothetical protein
MSLSTGRSASETTLCGALWRITTDVTCTACACPSRPPSEITRADAERRERESSRSSTRGRVRARSVVFALALTGLGLVLCQVWSTAARSTGRAPTNRWMKVSKPTTSVASGSTVSRTVSAKTWVFR